jgi:hypothetical protein
MKSVNVTIAGIAAISYLVPSSFDELKALISTDAEKAESVALNAANQYFLQTNLLNVRSKIAEALEKTYGIKPKLVIGKVEVNATTDADGKVSGYVSLDGKKKFKATDKAKSQSDVDFIERVVKEKEISESEIREIVQAIANANPFTAEQKRVRGSVTSKPVGKKWLTLAEKIIANGNGEKAADKIAKAIGRRPDVTGSDGAKRLALALSEEARLALAAIEASSSEYAGTEETPLVVDGTKA